MRDDEWFDITISNQSLPDVAAMEIYLHEHRNQVLQAPMDLTHNLHFYTNITHVLLNTMLREMTLPSSENMWKEMVASSMLLWVGDAVGIMRALGGGYFAACMLDPYNHFWFMQLEIESTVLLNQVFKYSSLFEELYVQELDTHSELFEAIEMREDHIFNSDDTLCSDPENATLNSVQWFTDITSYLGRTCA